MRTMAGVSKPFRVGLALEREAPRMFFRGHSVIERGDDDRAAQREILASRHFSRPRMASRERGATGAWPHHPRLVPAGVRSTIARARRATTERAAARRLRADLRAG